MSMQSTLPSPCFVTAVPIVPATATSHARSLCVRRRILASLHDDVSTEWGLSIDSSRHHASSLSLLHCRPSLLRHSSLLSASECEDLIQTQCHNTDESSLYLNYRVNTEVSTNTHSTEAAALIATTVADSGLQAGQKSGFRTAVSPDHPVLLNSLLPRLSELLGFGERKWVFEEGAWVRPNNGQVVVRDVTTVHYKVGEGVAPHVDGKDLTVLVCLQEPQKGGETAFQNEDVDVRQQVGAGIVYSSKKNMTHFARPVVHGEKWVLQLLIDYKVRADEARGVDFATGSVNA